MNRLTSQQVDKLTSRVNERFGEFAVGESAIFEPVTRGVMRLVFDVIEEWRGEEGEIATATEPTSGPLYIAPDKLASNLTTAIDRAEKEHVANGNGHAKELSSQAIATLGPEHVVVNPLRDDTAKGRGNMLPTREELIAEVRRQAMGGVMPTMAAFNDARPANWATAQAHLTRLGLSWEQLTEESGLKPNPRGPKQAQP